MDSLSTTSAVFEEFANTLKEAVVTVKGWDENEEWDIVRYRSTLDRRKKYVTQTNGWDCGVFVLLFALCKVLDIEPWQLKKKDGNEYSTMQNQITENKIRDHLAAAVLKYHQWKPSEEVIDHMLKEMTRK